MTVLAVDDLDNLLVVDDGVVRCFAQTADGVAETGAQGSPFAGLRVGRGFTVDRSTSNHEQRFHAHEGWREVADAERADRPGDLNGDAAVDGSDMAIVLGAWGSADPGAGDLTGDGQVNGADLAALLSAWGS